MSLVSSVLSGIVARIMDESKRLGYGLVLSEDAYEALSVEEKRACSELGEVLLRGKSRSVRLFGSIPQSE